MLLRMLIFLLPTLTWSSHHHKHKGYHHGKLTDYYGEYYYDSYGKPKYVYCYDPRFYVEDYCRPRPHYYHLSDYPYGISLNPAYYSLLYDKYWDGRGKVNVGKGRFYQRGRDVYIECDFPSVHRLVSNIVWYRKLFHEHPRYDRDFDRRRYIVQSVDDYTSRLIIRDYNSLDDGLYRCLATRVNGDTYLSKGKETVFMEVDVYKKSTARYPWR